MLTVAARALVCPQCGFYAVDGGDDTTGMMRLLADEYRKRQGLLTSVRIKEFRERRNETQKRFADYPRVGEASLKRWALGAIQDDAMDELIRLKCDLDRARENAGRLKKVSPQRPMKTVGGEFPARTPPVPSEFKSRRARKVS